MKLIYYFMVLITIIYSQLPVESSEHKLTGLLQYKGTDSSSESANAFVRRSRINLLGPLSPQLSYNIAYEFREIVDKKPHLVQAFIDWRFHDTLSLRMGQFHVPFGLEGPGRMSNHPAIERSYAVRRLNPFPLFRDTGIQLQTNQDRLSVTTAIISGVGANTADNNQSKDIVGRIGYEASKDLQLGTSFHYGVFKLGTTDLNRTRHGIDLRHLQGEHVLQAEYIIETDEQLDTSQINSSGWYVLYDHQFTPLFDGIIRYEGYDEGTNAAIVYITTVGMNYRPTNTYRFSLNYEFYSDNSNIANQTSAQIQILL